VCAEQIRLQELARHSAALANTCTEWADAFCRVSPAADESDEKIDVEDDGGTTVDVGTVNSRQLLCSVLCIREILNINFVRIIWKGKGRTSFIEKLQNECLRILKSYMMTFFWTLGGLEPSMNY
jgi:hypothetical protein